MFKASILAIILMVSTPSYARDHHRRDNSGPIIAGAVGGLLLGSILSNSNKRTSRNEDDLEWKYRACELRRVIIRDEDYGDRNTIIKVCTYYN